MLNALLYFFFFVCFVIEYPIYIRLGNENSLRCSFMLTLNAVWYGSQSVGCEGNWISTKCQEAGDIFLLTQFLFPLFCLTRLVDLVLKAIMRAMWFSGGFHWVRVKGQPALPSEAPILTMAPHSSYFDAIPVTMTMASIVMKTESKDIPVWGSEFLKIYKYTNI